MMLPFYSRGLGAATPGATDLIQQAALKYGVDPSLALALAKQESGYNQNARSSAGAVGVMQLMPGTAADLGVDPYDLAQNIDGGVRYLAQQLRTFGDPSLALAAYNAGPGAVTKYGTVPPYPETQNYVAAVLANAGTPTSAPDVSLPLDYSGTAGDLTTEPAADNTGLLLAAAAAVAAVAILA
jgi:soluble lytic murein transglycosylase-like protein